MSVTKSLWLAIPLALSIASSAEFPAPSIDTPAAEHKKKGNGCPRRRLLLGR